ncbi:MAG: tRNA (adenosine(37)-N6)-dimethylallyltransferase MiaA [Bacteroidales bacterium]|nr:tRNA (adenosine(37)-N6)-dimethylallyltransferase MiaA [Bacteroidales bacterium]
MRKRLIIIAGPTGIGKTDLSIGTAKRFDAEILSCDSRQFYKELGVGVAKPSDEQLKTVKHHFINNASINERYSIWQFEHDVMNLLGEYFKTHDNAIMCGGSGLYIDAVCNGIDLMPDPDPIIRQQVIDLYKNHGIEALRFELQRIDPTYYSQVDLKNPQRLMRGIEMTRQTGKPFSEFRTNVKQKRDFDIIKILLNTDRAKLYDRINLRVDKMMENGLLDEVKSLSEYKHLTALKSIGYLELFDYLDGKQSLEEAIELIKRNSRRYARRQLTWFHRNNDYLECEPDENIVIKNIENLIINN